MKKQTGIFTAILFAVSTLMVGCKAEVHTHTFAEEWKTDENFHWKECECGEIKFDAGHTFGEWEVIKKATEEAEGSQGKSCSVCEHKVTEVIAKLEHTHKFESEWTYDETNHWHEATCGCSDVELQKTAHTFGDWITTKEPTEEAEGSQERVCDVCKYKETAEIAQLKHKHVAGESWKNDDKNHWKECTGCKEQLESAEHEYEWTVTKEETCTEEGTKTGTCKVCKKEVTEKNDAKGHSFGIWTTTKKATCTEEGSKTGVCEVCKKEVTEKIDAKGHSGIWETTKEPTETESGEMQIVCEVCGETVTKKLQPLPKGFVFVKGTTITGTESWTPESEMFVNGRILTIPDLIVSDHEVTRGEYKAVMGSDPSWARAYDKDGNKLTGDSVSNNPVNAVNWYDALVYCNKLSMQENLTPCYSIDGLTDPDDWGEVPTLCDSTWDVATCNFKANGYRLPTEAEWEWLARGGEIYTYAGSDNVDEVAWYKSNTNDTGTREVKTKAPNGYGLYDMSGNVWEWCWDWCGSISSSTAADGPSSGNLRAYRGGSWAGGSKTYYRVSHSNGFYPNAHASDFGFRVVRQAN